MGEMLRRVKFSGGELHGLLQCFGKVIGSPGAFHGRHPRFRSMESAPEMPVIQRDCFALWARNDVKKRITHHVPALRYY